MTDLMIKKPRFWTKVIAGLIGALIASGQIPDVLLPFLSEGVYQALGGVVAAIMAGWVGKDKVQAKKRTKTKKDLIGLLVLPSVLGMV